jgi:hypothetical protein
MRQELQASAKTSYANQQKLAEARALAARFESAIEELRKEAQEDDTGSLTETISSCQLRRELTARIDGHRAALANSCGNVSLEEFVLQVQNINLDALPAELERIGTSWAGLRACGWTVQFFGHLPAVGAAIPAHSNSTRKILGMPVFSETQ